MSAPPYNRAHAAGADVSSRAATVLGTPGYCRQNLGALTTTVTLVQGQTDPIGLIEEARSLLVPGGLLLLISPNDFNPLQMTLWKQLGFQPWWVNPKHHLNYFDTVSAGRFMKARRFDILHLETSYPLENFLLAGRNYVGNPALGRECHNERKSFETALFRHDKPRMNALAASWAAQGIGREFIIVGKKP